MVQPDRAVGTHEIGLLPRAEVSREQEADGLAGVLDLHFDRGGPEEMSRGPVPDANTGRLIEPFSELDRLEQGQGRGDVLRPVDRFHQWDSPPLVAPVEMVDIPLLDVRRVGEHHLAQIACRAGAEDEPLEPRLDQLGQQAGVIDVRMGQEHAVDSRRIERKGLMVEGPQGLGTLKHAAINQEAAVIRPQQGAEAGHAARCAVEGQGQHGGKPFVSR